MEIRELSQKVREIEMSQEMKERIMKNCQNELEKNRKSLNYRVFRKPVAAAVSMFLCSCLVGVTALAATDTTGKLQGFFKDIIRWDGAVTGTSYEQATDEINMSVISVSDELAVMVEMVNPNIIPYKVFETFGIEDYEIVDENGKVVIEGDTTEFAKIVAGKTTIVIPISELTGGDYKLVVSGFVGSAKADQPMVLNGTLKCEFTR